MSHTILAKLDSDLISEISSLKNESDWLRKYRNDSLQTYENLPLETSNLYTKYTDAARMDPEIVKIAAKSDGAIPAFLQNRIKELKDIPHIVQIGTNIHNVHLPSKMKEQGVRICHIDEALADGTAKKIIESSDTSEDRFTALNSAAFNSGIYIEIPKNVQVADPIHIISCLINMDFIYQNIEFRSRIFVKISDDRISRHQISTILLAIPHFNHIFTNQTQTGMAIMDMDYSKYDFKNSTELYVHLSKKGLSKDVVRSISKLKDEPQWMLDFRLRAYDIFMKKPMPTWGADLSTIDFQNIFYYAKAKHILLCKGHRKNSLVNGSMNPLTMRVSASSSLRERVGMMFQKMLKIPLTSLAYQKLRKNS